jgi:hypothetical protein
MKNFNTALDEIFGDTEMSGLEKNWTRIYQGKSTNDNWSDDTYFNWRVEYGKKKPKRIGSNRNIKTTSRKGEDI